MLSLFSSLFKETWYNKGVATFSGGKAD
jgi:hypothetical protein